jgi:hypothetical protein
MTTNRNEEPPLSLRYPKAHLDPSREPKDGALKSKRPFDRGDDIPSQKPPPTGEQ